MRGIARAGLAARGVVYTVVGLLALQIAFGEPDERADKEGAFQAVARQPAGKVLLIILAVGLACYALWRLTEAVVNPQRDDDVAGGWAKRAGHLGRAAIYAFVCYSAVEVIAGAGSGGEEQERTATTRVLGWPLGPWIVGAVGIALLAASIWNFTKGLTGRYRKHLDESDMNEGERATAGLVAVVGHCARGVIFGLVGLFLLKAAWEHDPQESVGLDGALRRVADGPAGPWVLSFLALGLLAYGAFSFFQARYRRVLEP